jgi:prepilin-type N-terminal cleavage/methylation domain-containing protein
MLRRNRSGRGFSFLELVIALLIILILTAVVILVIRGLFSSATRSAMETEVRNIQTAVDAYNIKSPNGVWPTTDGRLPPQGHYALIDFGATFELDNKTWSFYPHYITNLPRHWDEGVWRLDSAALVTIDMPPEEY